VSFDARVGSVLLRVDENPFAWGQGPDLYDDPFKKTFDLDIQNAASVAITSDLTYGFVIDWYHPSMFHRTFSQPGFISQLSVNESRWLGAKVGVIRDPFGQPKYLGTTTPIDLGFGEELVLSPDDSKLYASYIGAQDILVFGSHGQAHRSIFQGSPGTGHLLAYVVYTELR